MQKITTFLWFNDQAEEAMQFYTSIFHDSAIHQISRAGDQVISGTFQLEGQSFMALNGGPHYSFTPAISLFVSCETQAEVDELWERLLAGGGEESRCGWLKDKFGLSWQIIPKTLGELMNDKDPVKAQRVMNAMLGMKKIVIDELKRAYEG
ncbi:VOC family protein [Paenibacillus soyae]|uniref:VOC family protein n=1 Tax=Paenibacillus soyae TaxID=2969249 RepID=A0A9X2MTA9_9BACL|nr:VOC family protein [Paenibacillus soyae]MCR2806424.1 VOC family protein [Paenibacillus soyae]